MTDRQALLASVLAAPDDDAPRLVFADWLDEHEEAERAEFVRLQINLARMKQPEEKLIGVIGGWREQMKAACVRCRRIAGPDLCDYHAGESRCTELTNAHGFGWLDGSLGDGWRVDGSSKIDATVFAWFHNGVKQTGKFGFSFRRGFPHEVQADAADWLRHADAILAEHPVTEVRLTTRPDRAESTTGGHYTVGEVIIEDLKSRWPTVRTWHLPPEQITLTAHRMPMRAPVPEELIGSGWRGL